MAAREIEDQGNIQLFHILYKIIWIVFEKLARACFFQIALKTILLPIALFWSHDPFGEKILLVCFDLAL